MHLVLCKEIIKCQQLVPILGQTFHCLRVLGVNRLVTRYDYDNAGRPITRHLPATEHAPPAVNTTTAAPMANWKAVAHAHAHAHAQRMIGEQQRHASIEGDSGWQ